ncbi:hypothetical protein HGRIS_010422 [Hohenbuehelia grisea]|uniref:Uncharacterized protein n=1 Tax=Hohenbuehelia grisea TaxID=104357 RepID=A0ABR3IZF2_9AGAR
MPAHPDVADLTQRVAATSLAEKQTLAQWLLAQPEHRLETMQGFLQKLDATSDAYYIDSLTSSLEKSLPHHLFNAYIADRVPRPLDDWKALLKEHPDLANFIPLAYKRKAERVPDPLEITAAQAKILAQAFTQPMQGNVVSRFLFDLTEFDDMYDGTKHYGRSIALTQASGKGKSFLVAHICQERLTVSICFRSLNKDMNLPRVNEGWPPQDVPICQFFVDHLSGFKGEELAGVFLGALFCVMTQILEEFPTLEGFNSQWEYGSTIREESFERVRAKAEELLSEHNVNDGWEKNASGIWHAIEN